MLPADSRAVLWMLPIQVKISSAFGFCLRLISFRLDFSDRLTRRKKAMYRTFVRRPPALETNEYEILPKDLTLEETPLQKLRRLMYEVQELNDEMEKNKVQ